MTDPALEDALIRSVKKLTVAVWALVVMVALLLLFVLGSRVWLAFQSDHVVESDPVRFSTSPSTPWVDSYDNFHEWPVEEQIESASVIVLTTWKRDGDRIRCVFTEILQHEPGVTFRYKVGDEYHRETRWIREDASYGDGQIIFFTGSPPSMKLMVSYENSRVAGLGDMPLATLRKLISERAK